MFAIAKNGGKCRNFDERSQIKVFLEALDFNENAIFGIFWHLIPIFSVKEDPSARNSIFLVMKSGMVYLSSLVLKKSESDSSGGSLVSHRRLTFFSLKQIFEKKFSIFSQKMTKIHLFLTLCSTYIVYILIFRFHSSNSRRSQFYGKIQ